MLIDREKDYRGNKRRTRMHSPLPSGKEPLLHYLTINRTSLIKWPAAFFPTSGAEMPLSLFQLSPVSST
uniref:Uncharacterized protein n=1 Tax=Anguilla anguilla TaxID=7936 RepID=A0A0E9WW39_ANGAN